MTRAYEYRHVATFEETNLIGNVYYVHFISWQGTCRELFRRDHAPDVLSELDRGLVLSTVRCSCSYGAELHAFDTVLVRMRLGGTVWNRIVLQFEYLREKDGAEEVVATGEQEIACMRRDGERLVDGDIPPSLLDALEPYRASSD